MLEGLKGNADIDKPELFYPNEDILMPATGKLNPWITIKDEGAKRPVLAGRNDLAVAINLSGVSYVRIENLEITHDDQAKGNAVYFRDGIVISE